MESWGNSPKVSQMELCFWGLYRVKDREDGLLLRLENICLNEAADIR